ncbi:hypothetical protein N7G274_001963 [Stereocaulon virgatum]|uniref:Mitochondrial ribosomal protein subunit L20-domain-containing protein n=1 Tax=Stereocaulon virgatum TaxID=373712 RepID=A0ABR4AJA6_9LECA
MSVFLPRRPPANLPSLCPSFAGLISLTARRHESSARRTTKRLRTKPDPSFTSSIPESQINDHIVFNPPSSAPSPYHTPPVFLPPNDPRRQLLVQSHRHANPYEQTERRLPPIIKHHQPYEKKYHLREKEIEEIRRLRTEDPYTWSRAKLAVMYGCSPFFVGIIAPNEGKRAEEFKKVEEVKENWGRRRRYAREDRAKRRKMWGRDE